MRRVPDEYHPPVNPGVHGDLLDRRAMQELPVRDGVDEAEHGLRETREQPFEIVVASSATPETRSQ